MTTATATTPASAPSLDGMLLLEAPFARVPHDELRRQLRSQQRMVERDLTFCASTLSSLASQPGRQDAGSIADAGKQSNSAAGDTSFNADTSFMSDSARPDDDPGEGDEEGEREVAVAGAPKSLDLDRSLDLMLGRLKGLKRKLTSVHDSTQSTLGQLEARTSHLDELHHISTTSSPAFDEWCRTRLDRMLVDWMLRKGYAQSAHTLAKSRRIESFVDLELFAEIGRVEASLIGSTLPDGSTIDRSCTPTLAWCSENKAALRKIKSTLEFDLRLQEFIELTRCRTPQSLRDAIAYGRRHLLPLLNASSARLAASASVSAAPSVSEKDERDEQEQQKMIRNKVGRAMGLLACGPGGWAYGDLYNDERWQALRESFRACALQIHSLPPQPILHVALSAGLSSLKLPACYADETGGRMAPAHLGGRSFGDERSNLLRMSGLSTTSVTSPPTFPPAAGIPSTDGSAPSLVLSPPSASDSLSDGKAMEHAHQSKSENCPVCDTNGLGILAKEVPWSHHANSTLVCAITGKIMDENNPPMALPNARIYSSSALEELAMNSHDGKTIVCPRTGDSFELSSLRKIYIS